MRESASGAGLGSRRPVGLSVGAELWDTRGRLSQTQRQPVLGPCCSQWGDC